MPCVELTTDLGRLVRGNIPSLTRANWEKLHEVLRRRREISVDDLARRSGVPKKLAVAVALTLHQEGLGLLKYHVFHQCRNQHVNSRDFKDGFEPTPFACPSCKETAVRQSELTYELRLRVA